VVVTAKRTIDQATGAELAPELFWLHIKKSAGQSTRQALGPLYTVTDRQARVAAIRDLPPAEWNDALNNYRMMLGAHQFRRTEYARQVLWPDRWDRMIRVGFAREPVSRCVSTFGYLFDLRQARHLRPYLTYLVRCGMFPWHRRLIWSRASAFDAYLDTLEWQASLRGGPDPAAPIDVHFSTHTNPMSLDVLDASGRLNLTHLIRLNSFEPGIELCYREMGVPRPDHTRNIRRNTTRADVPYTPLPRQKARIQALYSDDFDLFENAMVL
jgi:Sulfotransferase family